MKKVVSVFVLICMCMFFSSCHTKDEYIKDLSSLSFDDILSVNQINFNTISTPVCLYGSYLFMVDYNENTDTDNIKVFQKNTKEIVATFYIERKIISIKPFDKKNICYLLADDATSYYLLNFETSETTKITPKLKNDNEIIRIYPYFLNDAVYIAALIGIEGEYEPSLSIYKQTGDRYEKIISDCTQFQFTENSLFYSENNIQILKIDRNGKTTSFNGFLIDEQNSLLVSNNVVTINENDLEIVDIETGKSIRFDTQNAFTENMLISQVLIQKQFLIICSSVGIYVLDLQTSEIKYLCNYSPDNIVVLEDYIYFATNNSICRLNILNKQVEFLSESV